MEYLDKARTIIIQSQQHDAFKEELQCIREGTAILKQSQIYDLCPYIDMSGLLRVGERLTQASLGRDEISLLILPGQSHMMTPLI